MQGDDECAPVAPAQGHQEIENLVRQLGIEIADRFVRQHQLGFLGDDAGDPYPLLLAATEPVDAAVAQVGELHLLERGEGRLPVRAPHHSGDAQHAHAPKSPPQHVVEHAGARDQVEALEHEPDVALHPAIQAALGGDLRAEHPHHPTGGGNVGVDHAQQRGLAGTAGAEHHHPLPALHAQVLEVQDRYPSVAQKHVDVADQNRRLQRFDATARQRSLPLISR